MLKAFLLLVIGLSLTTTTLSINCNNLNYPRQYISYKLSENEKIVLDGKLDDKAWTDVSWSELFEDIEGPTKPKPYLDTRMKMRWDDEYLYIGGHMIEPQTWANLTMNNSIIFYDNDFEVFIDPDGSNHYYKELEMNARNLNWNLLLCRPYMNGGPPVCNITVPGECVMSAPQFGVPYWDISPYLPSGVYIDGEINNPLVGSKYWSIEIGIPIRQYLRYERSGPPKDGSYWRINFSRCEWHVLVKTLADGSMIYWKDLTKPVENWVWQPTYVNPPDMHLPETWGYLQFSTQPVNTTQIVKDPSWPVRDALMQTYYALTTYYAKKKNYTTNLNELVENAGLPLYVANGECAAPPVISITPNSFIAWVFLDNMIGSVQNDRLLNIDYF